MFKLEYLILVTALVSNFATTRPFSPMEDDALKVMKRGLNAQNHPHFDKRNPGDYGTYLASSPGEKYPENHGDDTSQAMLPPHGITRKKAGKKVHSPLHKSSPPGHVDEVYGATEQEYDETYNHKKELKHERSGYSTSTSQGDQVNNDSSNDKKVSAPPSKTSDQEIASPALAPTKESGFEVPHHAPHHKKPKKPSHKKVKQPSYPVPCAIPPPKQQPDISDFPPYRLDVGGGIPLPGPLPSPQKKPNFGVPSSPPPEKINDFKAPSAYPHESTENKGRIQNSLPPKEDAKYGSSSQNDSSTSQNDVKNGSNDNSSGY